MIRIPLILLALASLGAAQSDPCMADAFLDVSEAPGAGPAYPRPRVEATCEGDQLVVRSNGIPHYEFVQVTPNPLLERNNEFRLPAKPELAEAPIPIRTKAPYRRKNSSAIRCSTRSWMPAWATRRWSTTITPWCSAA